LIEMTEQHRSLNRVIKEYEEKLDQYVECGALILAGQDRAQLEALHDVKVRVILGREEEVLLE